MFRDRVKSSGAGVEQPIEFGEFTFQPATGQLWRDGAPIHVTPKAAAVLRELAASPGAPVPKASLFARVWRGTVVTDDALTSCILELRKALGDDPRAPRYIATRHRRGYQFIADARPAAPPPPAVPVAVPAIAVLPFSDISQERDQDYYCDGLAVELIGLLSQVQGVRVVSRMASFQFRGQGADVRAVGSHLGARYLLEGSIRKAPDRLRVAVQLVDVETGYQQWSRLFDCRPEDVFTIQGEIAEGVVRVLKGEAPGDGERLRLEPLRTGTVAYEHYLRGLQTLPRMSREGLRRSALEFERAVGVDPGYAPAHAGLAMVHATLHEWFGGDGGHLARAEEASARAIALAPALAEAHVARGFALGLGGDHAGAVAEFTEAIRLNPQLFEARYYYARASFAAGEMARACELFREASELRREDFQSAVLWAQGLRMQGRLDEAAEADLEGVRRAERALALDPADSRALSLGSHALLHAGQVERALEWTGRALELHPDDMSTLINAALMHLLLGDKARALDLLERAFSQGWGKRDWIERDPDYDALRDDPRFQRLLQRLR